jgi:hypothetical protein
MADISMCANQTCPDRSMCYRYMATASSWQSYCGFCPPPGASRCSDFIPIQADNPARKGDQ